MHAAKWIELLMCQSTDIWLHFCKNKWVSLNFNSILAIFPKSSFELATCPLLVLLVVFPQFGVKTIFSFAKIKSVLSILDFIVLSRSIFLQKRTRTLLNDALDNTWSNTKPCGTLAVKICSLGVTWTNVLKAVIFMSISSSAMDILQALFPLL